VEEEVLDLALTKQVIDRCAGIPVETVTRSKDLIANYREKRFSLSEGKRTFCYAKTEDVFLSPVRAQKRLSLLPVFHFKYRYGMSAGLFVLCFCRPISTIRLLLFLSTGRK